MAKENTDNTTQKDTWWIIDPTKFEDATTKTPFYFNGKTGAVTFDPSPSVTMIAKPFDPPQPQSSYLENFEQGSRKFWKANDNNTKGFRMMLAGGTAGAVAKSCVAPLERIKMLLQVHGMSAKPNTPSPGIIATAKKVLMVDGPGGFWKGNVANVVRIIPTKGILFACNDKFRVFFKVDPKNPQILPLVASGASAGMTSTLLTYPLDLVRSRLMMMGSSAGAQQYTGIIDCFSKTIRLEGVRGLYGGLGPTLVGIVPYAGVSFASFDVMKKYMPKDEYGQTKTYYKLLCGAIAGFVSQTVSYPVDTVRRRLQLQGSVVGEKMYSSAFDCIRQIYKSEGMFAFYRGLTTNLMRAAPNTAIQFTAYEQFCKWLNLKK